MSAKIGNVSEKRVCVETARAPDAIFEIAYKNNFKNQKQFSAIPKRKIFSKTKAARFLQSVSQLALIARNAPLLCNNFLF